MNAEYPSGPKSEWLNQAERITSGDIATSAHDIPMLLEWLQDMNWPGAPEIAEYLSRFGKDLVEPLRVVLQSSDGIWKYWVLTSFATTTDKEFWVLLSGELKAVAADIEDEEYANLEALYIIAMMNLEERTWIEEMLRVIRSRGLYDSFAFEKIEGLLKK